MEVFERLNIFKQKKSCLYCGNNPVPHFIFWYDESLNVLFTPLRQKLLYNGLMRLIKKSGFDRKIWSWLLPLLESLKIIKRQEDVKQCKVRRAQVLWEEAEKRGIKMNELLFFNRPVDVYTAQKENLEIIFSGMPRPSGYFNRRLDLMDDKAWLKKIFQTNSLPVANGGGCFSLHQAEENFSRIAKPAIVKPRLGSRGRHSSTFVYNLEDLEKAFLIAKQLCFWAVVEEQLTGPVYRATLINFELCGVLRGDPPNVVGDGVKTIEELVKIKNSLPHEGVKEIKLDEPTERFLSRQKFQLSSVLPKGQSINLSEKIGVNYGGSSSEDLEICHPDNKELFVKASRVLGDPIVGFDFIIPDISKSWKDQKGGFIEANSLPFINLHHDPLHGQPKNVAAKVWDMLRF